MVEALITLLVVSVSFVALGRLQAQLWQGQAEVGQTAQAITLAAESLDELGELGQVGDASAVTLVSDAGTTYRVTGNTAAIDGSALLRFEIGVEWSSGDRDNRLNLWAIGTRPQPIPARRLVARLDDAEPRR